MTADEIVAELRAIRYGRPTMSGIAKAANISRTMLYDVIISGNVTERSRAGLERALQDVRKQRGYNRRSAPS